MNDSSPQEDKKRLHAIVYGRVQGVNFRAYTARRGRELGLTGWVRNRPDGTVETLAEGDQASLEALLEFLRVGPPSAHVSRVEHLWEEGSGDLEEFTIRYF